MRRKETDSIKGIDSAIELGAYALKSVLRQWWKIAILAFIAGVAVSGYKVQCGKIAVEKSAVDLKKIGEENVK